MMGFGFIIAYVGYAVLYWGVNAIQGNSQAPFMDYLFPFSKKSS